MSIKTLLMKKVGGIQQKIQGRISPSISNFLQTSISKNFLESHIHMQDSSQLSTLIKKETIRDHIILRCKIKAISTMKIFKIICSGLGH